MQTTPTLLFVIIHSITRVFHLVHLFGLASGSKLNKEKTWGVWLGGWRYNLESPCDIHSTNTFIKLCGVILGNGDVSLENWKTRQMKIVHAVAIHSERALPLRGKSIIAQSVICSKLWFVGSIIQLPNNVAREIQSTIFRFIWGNKPESIKRTCMFSGYDNGGMNVINIAVKLDAFQVFHLYKLIKGHSAKWTYFAIYWLGHKLRGFSTNFASNLVPHAFTQSKFYYAFRKLQVF